MSMPVKRGTPQGWIPSIFNDFFNNEWLIHSSSTAPAINVIEGEKCYTVEVAAPGMTKEDFNIHLNSDNNLCITMERNCNCNNEKECCSSKEDSDRKEGEEPKGRYLRREFSYTKFKQTLLMPDDVDTTKIEAKMNNGVLLIHIPNKVTTEPQHTSRTIAIG